MTTVNREKHRGGWIAFLLGFGIPAALGLIGYIVIQVWPFGNGTVLVIDSLHQYLPFYTDFHEKLRTGSSLFYSFRAGFGYDFWATYAYYLACPLNFLIVLVPKANVCDFMDYLILFKIGMCGAIFSWYLHQRSCALLSEHRTEEDPGDGEKIVTSLRTVFLPAVFGTMFAMGNFIIGYYFNLMWLDSIAVLPLIMLGIERISKGKGGWLYGLSLFYGIWCNYYIGFMLCIFACLYFLTQLIAQKGILSRRLPGKCVRFGWYSLLAGGMASVVILPAYLALTASESMQKNSFPSSVKFYVDALELLLSHGIEQHPINISDSQVGLNAYCGTAVLILIILYLLDRKISLREKAGKAVLCGILLLSFSMNILNYIWHGFHTQNGLPNRFAFLYVCLILIMAFDTLQNIMDWRPQTIPIAGGILVILFAAALLLGKGDTAEYGNFLMLTPAALLIWTIALMLIAALPLSALLRYAIVGGLLLAEAGAHGIYGYIYNENVTRDIYLKDQASWQELVGSRQDGSFFRSEIDSQRMRNVTMFAGGNSTIIFNSMMQVSVTDFCSRIGMEARTNKNGYLGMTELMNDVFGIRYVLSTIGKGDALYHFPKIGDDGNLTLYYNENALPLGFMVNPELKFWVPEEKHPMEAQNQFVILATGQEGIYVLDRTIDAVDGETYQIRVPERKQVYLYLPSRAEQVRLKTPEYERTYKTYTDHLYTVNALGEEDIAEVTLTLKSTDTSKLIEVYTCPDEALKNVVDELAQEPFLVQEAFGNRLSGEVSAAKEGILLITIPYSKNWSVTVDQKKGELLEIGGMLAGIELEAGDHQIAMVYTPAGIGAGLGLSLLCALLMAVSILAERKRKFRTECLDQPAKEDTEDASAVPEETEWIQETEYGTEDIWASGESEENRGE